MNLFKLKYHMNHANCSEKTNTLTKWFPTSISLCLNSAYVFELILVQFAHRNYILQYFVWKVKRYFNTVPNGPFFHHSHIPNTITAQPMVTCQKYLGDQKFPTVGPLCTDFISDIIFRFYSSAMCCNLLLTRYTLSWYINILNNTLPCPTETTICSPRT